MTTAFHIELNGTPLCLAGVEEGVLTAITAHNTNQESLSFKVGGLLAQSTHLTWAQQNLTVGDKITIEVIEVNPDSISPPIEERTEQADFAEQQERLYFEKLKQKYEPAA